MGLVAVRDIKKGEVIVKEKPLFVLSYDANDLPKNLLFLKSLPEKSKRKIMYLSPSKHSRFWYSPAFKIHSNSLALDREHMTSVGSYIVSRINHSCSPNVVFSSMSQNKYPTLDQLKVETIVVVATKDIKKGEEICRCYIPTIHLYLTAKERQKHLSTQFSDCMFEKCICPTCLLPSKLRKRSDKNRLELEAITNDIEVLKDPELKVLKKLTDRHRILLKEEGLDTPENLQEVNLKLLHACETEEEVEIYKKEMDVIADIIRKLSI